MLIGVDEVGRGCWAGPLVASAVGLVDNCQIAGLTDSKKLSANQRQALDKIIRAQTELIGIGWVSPIEINTLGLTESVRLAMQRAIDQIEATDCPIVVDGSINYLAHLPNSSAVIKADGSVPAVSAASIIAKVARDAFMTEAAKQYPHYSFEKHVGYGTKLHLAALKKYGVLPIHRLNYKPIKALLVS